MEENEKQKEIEWLMDTIKRDFARNRTIFVLSIIMMIVIACIAFYAFARAGDDEFGDYYSTMYGLLFGGVLGTILGVIALVQGKQIKKASSAQQLLDYNDKSNKLLWVLIPIAIVALLAFMYFRTDNIQKLIVTVLYFASYMCLFYCMRTNKLLWVLLTVAISVCMMFLADWAWCLMGIAVIIIYFYRKHTKWDPKVDGPEDPIKQLRELVKEDE